MLNVKRQNTSVLRSFASLCTDDGTGYERNWAKHEVLSAGGEVAHWRGAKHGIGSMEIDYDANTAESEWSFKSVGRRCWGC